jgi:hypothetical protein
MVGPKIPCQLTCVMTYEIHLQVPGIARMVSLNCNTQILLIRFSIVSPMICKSSLCIICISSDKCLMTTVPVVQLKGCTYGYDS